MATRNRIFTMVLALIALLLAACGAGEQAGTTAPTETTSGTTEAAVATTAAPETTTTAEPVETATIEIAWNANDYVVADLPALVAFDALREKGWTINTTFVAEPEQAVQAVARGQAQMGQFNPLIILAAAEQGEPVQAFFDWKRHAWTLVAQPDIASIAALEGRNLGVHSETSFTMTAAQLIIEENGLQDVEILIVPGSEVRAQAIAQGELDSTLLLLDDMIAIEHELGYEFNVLESLAETYPHFPVGHFALNSDWAAENEDAVVQLIEELIVATDFVIDEPEAAAEIAIAFFDDIDPAIVTGILDSYGSNSLWVRDGGLTEESATTEISFYFDSGQTGLEPNTASVEQAYALSYLEAAKSALGR